MTIGTNPFIFSSATEMIAVLLLGNMNVLLYKKNL
jgi:hypothetical protein